MRIHRVAALLCAVSMTVSQANASFPEQPIDCSIFEIDNPNFLGHSFGFATELSYSDSFSPTATTGSEGFVATPEQVAGIPDFAEGADLPTGGQTLDDLFPGGVGLPTTLEQGEISQSIQGEGNFSEGFSEVTISQRKRLSTNQGPGGFSSVFAQGKGFAPFQVASGGEGPVDASLTIDLFSTFDYSEGGSLSEFLGLALLDISDPQNPWIMDTVSGFYFIDATGAFASFSVGENNEQDVSDSFFTGPSGTEPDSPSLASFFYTINTQLTPGSTYGIGLVGDGSVSAQDDSFSWLDSGATLTGTIAVQTPGARLYLPGFVVPEPTTLGLASFAALIGLAGVNARNRRWLPA
ncbi:MAG: PEP-CTERM sorting domain-containing protein [Planctomycetota bacterium]